MDHACQIRDFHILYPFCNVVYSSIQKLYINMRDFRRTKAVCFS
jgi:hypothetical protein